MKIALVYLATLIIFFAVDIFWLGWVAPSFYRKHIGHLLADKFNMVAAMAFYVIYIGGLVAFVIYPALEGRYSLGRVALWGALFGFITYATYDLTNHATMRDWPLIVTISDMAWGTFLCATVSTLTFLLARRFFYFDL